MTIRLSKDRQI